ncbi:cytochrome c oxidase assembly protein [Hyphobacterium sp. SN044]|uniref:cytochrome c oxidase assembly protein n=1 Tax=Hyphobacterium sp. SN044 TaxID=2912575 RepID=UPI001F31CD6F|nr:cytochrome c oxidase assembly protein [Hyphobacterium sp. SN044]MCF8880890.1 cytochrome c oxidase assembly protein [Hyphobacterium sp. SN044]
MNWLPKNKNTRLMAICATVAVSMVGAAYAAVPLYDLFCRVTGYGGTPQVRVAAADRVIDREVTVRFDASRNGGLPWEFQPIDRAITVNVGESALAYFRATNTSDRPITGVATYNVTPFKAAPYFVKIECFCFTEQTLQPGESIEMPVLFFVDPEIETDRRADDIQTITLSYTFFEAENSELAAASGRDAAP